MLNFFASIYECFNYSFNFIQVQQSIMGIWAGDLAEEGSPLFGLFVEACVGLLSVGKVVW